MNTESAGYFAAAVALRGIFGALCGKEIIGGKRAETRAPTWTSGAELRHEGMQDSVNHEGREEHEDS